MKIIVSYIFKIQYLISLIVDRMDFSRCFSHSDFTQSTDPYKLVLVSRGLRSGHVLYDVDKSEVEQLGVYEDSQGRKDLENTLKELALPYKILETSAEVDQAYGHRELTLFTYFVANDPHRLKKYEDEFNRDMDCHKLGEFEGLPDCCVDTYCDGYNNPSQYLEEIQSHVAGNAISDKKLLITAVLPELSHYPCSPECEQSLKMGENNMDFFRNEFEEAYNHYITLAENRTADLDIDKTIDRSKL